MFDRELSDQQIAFTAGHFSIPIGIAHSTVDVTFRCFKSRRAQKNNAAQALAKALKVNKTVTTIHLNYNEIGNAGAKAWCLARGFVASGLETVK